MPPGPVEPDTLSLWMELFSVMKDFVFSPPLRLLSNCRNFVHLESRIAEADRRLLRWLNTVLAVCELYVICQVMARGRLQLTS